MIPIYFLVFSCSRTWTFFFFPPQMQIQHRLKQFVYVVAGFIIMILISQPDPDILEELQGFFLFFHSCCWHHILVWPEINGAQRWVRIGPFSFQSSELLKLAVPIFLANFLFNKKLPIQRNEIFLSLLIIFFCFFIVFRQPDLGTALIIAFSGLFVLFLSGLSWTFMGGSLVFLILSSPFIWNILLQPFQRQRIATFFNQDSDPFGARWNIIQSKVAIGSGGFWKRFREGSQTQLNFLPETETDFIFLSSERSLIPWSIIFIKYLFIYIIKMLLFGIKCKR